MFYMGAKTHLPSQSPRLRRTTWGEERGRWPMSLLIFSDEITKMPVTYTTYVFPIETLNRVFTCAARMPVRNNDLWDRCDPKRWQ